MAEERNSGAASGRSARYFSWARFWAVLVKEFVQMRRDRLTFAMMAGIPVIQLILFGYAINTDPRGLPTAVVAADHSAFSRSLLYAIENTGYFRIVRRAASEAEAERLLAVGEVQFVVTVPEQFARRLVRGERPALLVEADASDPAATSNALAALAALAQLALERELAGSLAHLRGVEPPFELRVHRRYNPEGVTQYNVVPGLIGTILTMTMVMMTALAMTRERERGTMENLLATPARPAEVMAGKIVPYIVVGYVQVAIILLAARLLFGVPMVGSLALLSLVLVVFIAANLAVGFTFSTLARNQLQAVQMAFFFFLPSILLSGFMFPFRGMPQWAQWLGEALPLTHFLRILRGILLKGNGAAEIAPNLWPIAVFLFLAAALALWRYRETLD
jgi:ABC-2 type transport system permease protein